MSDLKQLRQERLLRIYRRHPEFYAEQVLGVTLTSQQVEILRALVKHRRVKVRASHSVGKTFLGGAIVNWFYDCFDPSITLTTAPTEAQVRDLLWKEVRTLRRGRPGLLPRAPRMESAPNHFAVGYTASDPESFQGRHEERVLIIFDEDVGIDAQFWIAAEGMMTGESCYWLVIGNPTDTTSESFAQEDSGSWHIITISAMDHPNIAAELRGEAAPFPAAVRLGWVRDKITQWCEPLPPEDAKATDFEFPASSGNWYRPGPLFEGRVMGRWPTAGSTSIWNDAMWQSTLVEQPIPADSPTEIGVDVARFGTDSTVFHVRRGPCSLWHVARNGWSTSQTAAHAKLLAKRFAKPGEDPHRVAIKIDDDGVGGGVTDQRGEYNFVGMSSASTANDPELYPNRRSEAWFVCASKASERRIDLSRLPQEVRKQLKKELFAPKWKVDGQGRRVVEPKDDTRKKLEGASPDNADAFHLAHAVPRPVGWASDPETLKKLYR